MASKMNVAMLAIDRQLEMLSIFSLYQICVENSVVLRFLCEVKMLYGNHAHLSVHLSIGEISSATKALGKFL